MTQRKEREGGKEQTLTKRENELMMESMRDSPQQASKEQRRQPQGEFVGIQEHHAQCFQGKGEVVVRYAHTDSESGLVQYLSANGDGLTHPVITRNTPTPPMQLHAH
jgi:hypothetical protein